MTTDWVPAEDAAVTYDPDGERPPPLLLLPDEYRAVRALLPLAQVMSDHDACNRWVMRLKDRAETAEALLARVRRLAEQSEGTTAKHVLAIICSDEKGGGGYDRDFDGPVL